ncbi:MULTISPECIES: hypothetical protein [Bradyrhizobium]|jgi:hypothetical protein|uniref:hypothetical protein n=1 Tax=Bradyrhizobium TaxID=374 RepID=UPI00293E1448|nr:hypothetical protein [Bradyrhizobium sp. NDS-1]MBR0815952.1 hypothetical protein [Bradyrhizobium diazoefficiens]WOH72267.1 hypothetical protein RX330_28870 [Bradyrhizobium sp. NDS-1]
MEISPPQNVKVKKAGKFAEKSNFRVLLTLERVKKTLWLINTFDQDVVKRTTWRRRVAKMLRFPNLARRPNPAGGGWSTG